MITEVFLQTANICYWLLPFLATLHRATAPSTFQLSTFR